MSIAVRSLSIALVTLSMIVLLGCENKPKSSPATHDFSLKDINGKTVTLSELKGNVVMLEFWAIW